METIEKDAESKKDEFGEAPSRRIKKGDKKLDKKEVKEEKKEEKKEEVKKYIKLEKKEESKEVKQEIIYIDASVNELYSRTTIKQSYENKLDNPIEFSVKIPVSQEDFTLEKFEIEIGKEKKISKVYKKDKAEEKFSDAMAGGNTAIFSEKDDRCHIIKIGNLPAKEKLIITSHFIQLIQSKDMSYEYVLMQSYPTLLKDNRENVNFKSIDASVTFNTKSRITRFVPKNLLNCYKVEEQVSDDHKNITLKLSNSIQDIVSPLMDKKDLSKQLGRDFIATFLSIIFRTEDIYKTKLYRQYDSALDETAYALSYTKLSPFMEENGHKLLKNPNEIDKDPNSVYVQKIKMDEMIYDTPCLFIFLIDQSGSMGGASINIVRETLTLFFSSLPAGSYFQLIGFGSSFYKYNEHPIEYTQQNVETIMKYVKNLRADLGGTNLYYPLSEIYLNMKEYDDIPLAKNLYILTDGELNDKQGTLDLILLHNAKKFRIQAIGIGDEYDHDLIYQLGKIGNGDSLYIEDLKNLNNEVINSLTRCLRPYLANAKISQLGNTKAIFPAQVHYSYLDEPIYFTFIREGKGAEKDILLNMDMKIRGVRGIKDDYQEAINIPECVNLEDGDALHKITIGNLLNTKNKPEGFDEVVNSLRYQLLSSSTALFAEIEGEKLSDPKELMQVQSIGVEITEKESLSSAAANRKAYYNPDPPKQIRHDDFYNNPHSGKHMLMSSEPKARPRGKKGSKKSNLAPSKTYSEESSSSISSVSPSISSSFSKPAEPEPEVNNENYYKELISSLNGIQGYWTENPYTKFAIKKFSLQSTLDKAIDFAKTKISDGELAKKMAYTFIVIYLIYNKLPEKKNESKLVISKANRFLENNGLSYDDIMKQV